MSMILQKMGKGIKIILDKNKLKMVYLIKGKINMRWIIQKIEKVSKYQKKLYWSNEWGWTTKRFADKFSDKEKNTLNLPLEGKWVTSYPY
jgi:hypothetical protein